MKMRVLVVIDSLAVGGAEQSLLTLTPHLMERGVDLHVAHLAESKGIGPALEEGGATLHSLAGRGGRFRALQRTRRLVTHLEPDLLHTTLFESDLIGRTAGWLGRVPVVSSFVTEAYGPEHVRNPEYRAWKVRGAQLADAVTARCVRRFHAVSASSAEVMARRLLVSPAKIDVVPRGRDPLTLGTPSQQRRDRVRASLGLADAVPLVVAVGRHYNLKGLDILMQAFPQVTNTLPSAQLLIAGRAGPATADLQRLVATGGIDDAVTMAGFRSDVPDLICAADVFVLPSRAEGSPGALLEAMALGAPTVATDIPAVREVAGSGQDTICIVPLDDPDAMASAVVRLLTHPGDAKELAAAAQRRFTAGYTVDTIADRMVALYETCLSSTPVSAPLG